MKNTLHKIIPITIQLYLIQDMLGHNYCTKCLNLINDISSTEIHYDLIKICYKHKTETKTIKTMNVVGNNLSQKYSQHNIALHILNMQ